MTRPLEPWNQENSSVESDHQIPGPEHDFSHDVRRYILGQQDPSCPEAETENNDLIAVTQGQYRVGLEELIKPSRILGLGEQVVIAIAEQEL